MCKGSITHQVTYKRETDGTRSLLRGPVRLITSNTALIVQGDAEVDTFDPGVSLATVLHPSPTVVALDPGAYQAHVYFSIDIPGLVPDVTAVEQFIGGAWVSLAFTRELIGLGVVNDLLVVLMAIEVTDAAAETITGVGTGTSGLSVANTVAILGVGTVTVAQIPQSGVDRGYVCWLGNFATLPSPPGSGISRNVRGTSVSRRPFAGTLALQIDYDPESINGTGSNARYYKWFVRKAATTLTPAGAWTRLGTDTRVYYRARYQDPVQSIDVDVYLPYSTGLDEQGFSRFRPALADLYTEKRDVVVGHLQAWFPTTTINPAQVQLNWPLTRLFDHASGYFPTAGRDPGVYELKLCVYDNTRTLLTPGTGVDFRFPGEPVPGGDGWMIPTATAPAAHEDLTSSDPGVFFAVHVDGTPCTGDIKAPTGTDITPSGSCGLYEFTIPAATSDVEIDFDAAQANQHATYVFWVRRGHNVPTDGADLRDEVNVSGTGTWKLALDKMLSSSCPSGAAYAANLVVAHTATDGRHNELRSLWLWDERAFALVGQ